MNGHKPPYLGFGLGLRPQHYEDILSGDPDIVFNAFRWMDEKQCQAVREGDGVFDQARDFASSLVHALYGFPQFRHFEDGNRKRRQRDDCCWRSG